MKFFRTLLFSLVMVLGLFTTSHAALTDDLAAFWNLNEVSGTRADSAGTNTLAEVGGTVSSAAGRVTTSALFSGANALTVADNAAVSTGDIDFTLSGWVYLASKSASQGIIVKRDSSSTREYAITYSSVNGFTFVVSSNGSGTGEVSIAVNNTALPTDAWYYVVAWHDSVNNTINIQVNNSTVYTAAHSAGVFNSTSSFTIGAFNGGTATFL